jgi:hypothetical protein
MFRYKNTSDGFIGMWGHTFNRDGSLDWQFQVIRRSGDVYLVEIFSWKDGRPTHVGALNRRQLLGLKLYQSSEAMNAAMEKHNRQRRLDREEVVDQTANVVKLPLLTSHSHAR